MNPDRRPLYSHQAYVRQEHLVASIDELRRHIRRFRLQIGLIVIAALLAATVISGFA